MLGPDTPARSDPELAFLIPLGGPPIRTAIWAAPASHFQLPCQTKQKPKVRVGPLPDSCAAAKRPHSITSSALARSVDGPVHPVRFVDSLGLGTPRSGTVDDLLGSNEVGLRKP